MSRDDRVWLLMVVAIVVAAVFMISAYGCTSQPAQPVEIDHPDFYDRTGNACWRLTDMIWCDDGYGSWEDNEEQAHGQAQE